MVQGLPTDDNAPPISDEDLASETQAVDGRESKSVGESPIIDPYKQAAMDRVLSSARIFGAPGGGWARVDVPDELQVQEAMSTLQAEGFEVNWPDSNARVIFARPTPHY